MAREDLRADFQRYFNHEFPNQRRVVYRAGPLPEGWTAAFSRATERSASGYRIVHRVTVAKREVLAAEEPGSLRNFNEDKTLYPGDLPQIARNLILSLIDEL